MSTTDRTATCAIRELVLAALLATLLGACEGDQGPPGPPGEPGGGGDEDEPTPTEYTAGDAVPRLSATIVELRGASGPAGEFQQGDVVTVVFRVEKEDGASWKLDELVSGEALVSGPTSNYQRVLPLEDDVRDRAVEEAPGTFAFTFAAPIPSLFAPPYNDTPSFGQNQGDLGGRPLQDGTYTVGLSFAWNFTVDDEPDQRVGEATLDFLLGTGAGALTPRAVTSIEHCNRCHGELEAHDGRYRALTLCFLCHTSGAEDANDPALANGTPAVTIDSRVLFHKLHDGRYLPSVNGMSTRVNGGRNYDATPRPLLYARPTGVVRDFSHVGFPAMPNRVLPMPRDTGYANLTAAAQAKEDLVRSGVAQCPVCHGDPDGPGGLETPAQGAVIYAQLTRRACGSCHDDVNFANSYDANSQSMPPQPNDVGCNACHDNQFPAALNPIDAHVHPLARPDENLGVVVELLGVVEAGTNDLDGTVDPGEGVALEFRLLDGTGAALDPAQLAELRAVVSGPTTSFQVLLDEPVPLDGLTGPQPFEVALPERVRLELVGRSTAGTDVFATARTPHRTGATSATEVRVRTSTSGGSTALASSGARHAASIVVADATGFRRGEFLVIDDGVPGAEEYQLVSRVEGDRLWIADPAARVGTGLSTEHAAGASVREVQLDEALEGVHYTLDPDAGTISELVEFGAGNAVLVSYTSDFVLPDEYPAPHDDSDGVGELAGEWTGQALVPGTYVVSLTAGRDFSSFAMSTTTQYRASSPSATLPFLVGSAAELEPYTRIADGAACNACHQDLVYHDGTARGFDSCILCHGAPGTEDLPRYAAASAPETPGLSVQFRFLLHRIHRGRESGDPDFEVVGTGPAPFPDNFTVRRYADFSPFPVFPGRTLECERCHGAGNLEALLPSAREHPTEQEGPIQVWRPVCSGCHGSPAQIAHVDSNTAPSGAEACEICHARGEFEDALEAHGLR
jgi:hypothetical protein